MNKSTQKSKPPKLALFLLLKLVENKLDTNIGDFEEEFSDNLKEKGYWKAYFLFWIEVFISVPGFFSLSFAKNLSMIRNYLKSSVRNLKKNPGFSLINIAGLSFGMMCSILISIWVLDELSFDNFHENAENIYRVEASEDHGGKTFHTFTSPVPLAPVAEEEIPEIKYATRLTRFGGFQAKAAEKIFYESNVIAADPSIFKMFTFPFTQGDMNTALDEPLSIVISEQISLKYFGTVDAIGKTIKVEDEYDFTVTGVLKDMPGNSSINLNIVVHFDFVMDKMRRMPSGWVNALVNYVQVVNNSDLSITSQKITDLVYKKSGEKSTSVYELSNLDRVHLYSYRGYDDSNTAVQYVYIFSIIGFIIMVIAAINFMNLSTSRSAVRAKEIGLRKVVGAYRGNIIHQFLGESILVSFISLGFSVVFAVSLLPLFNEFAGKALTMGQFLSQDLLLTLLGIGLFTGIFSGIYPAFYLSAFNPIQILSNMSHRISSGRQVLRKSFVVFQFALAIFLIISGMIAIEQLNFMKNEQVGFDKDHLIYIQMREGVLKSYDRIKNEYEKIPGVTSITATGRRPSFIGDTTRDITWDGKSADDQIQMTFWPVEYDFVETLKLDIIKGRSFSKDIAEDRKSAFLVNEKAVEAMGMDQIDPIGKSIKMIGVSGTIIGVMKDFHHKPLREEIAPMVVLIAPNPYWLGNVILRIDPKNVENTVESLKSTWETLFTETPFAYNYLDEDFERMYRTEERLGNLLKYFSIIAIFIACLGLFGLSAFTAEQKTKEIGIRKVLGSSNTNIVYMLSKEFSLLILFANVTAWPIAWYVTTTWLQDFAFRINVEPEIFIYSGVISLLITLISVGYQSIKAAVVNPVEFLRYE